MKRILFIILPLLVVLGTAGCKSQRPEVATVGEPAPVFYLSDTKGRSWNLEELKGKVVFVNFWATWCAPCREEMPAMQRLMEALPKDTFVMLAILNRDTPANANLFAEKLGITIPILNDMGNNVGPMYGLTGLPETFIIDKKGILRYKYIGPAKWDTPEFIQQIKELINEQG